MDKERLQFHTLVDGHCHKMLTSACSNQKPGEVSEPLSNQPSLLFAVVNGRGFCYFNSVAIAAKLLQQRLNVSKILIVDWVSIARACVCLFM